MDPSDWLCFVERSAAGEALLRKWARAEAKSETTEDDLRGQFTQPKARRTLLLVALIACSLLSWALRGCSDTPQKPVEQPAIESLNVAPETRSAAPKPLW